MTDARKDDLRRELHDLEIQEVNLAERLNKVRLRRWKIEAALGNPMTPEEQRLGADLAEANGA